MKKGTFIVAALLLGASLLKAQDNTFRITVLAYQWTTSHRTLTFSTPGTANTSCNGTETASAYGAGGNVYANGSTSSNCSTVYTPPSSQNIDVQKPVVYILADSDTNRMILMCTRNVRWSQCEALNPGVFVARIDKGHFEVEGVSGKGKEDWVKFDIVQQTALIKQAPSVTSAQTPPVSIEAPASQELGTSNSNSGFPSRWMSMTSGTVRTMRFQGDYIYTELVLPEAAAKAGAFQLSELKKDGDKYVGKTNTRAIRADGAASCSFSWQLELTLVTPDRIEGRVMSPPQNAKIDWTSCSTSLPADWQSFVWIPVK
ncbi:MAG TPA: hypothetical protein VMB02_12585 [Candidatus Aquilonibacter sp.]|nr:hypothetical protein [Candidatus Aquilonibacter sp.]